MPYDLQLDGSVLRLTLAGELTIAIARDLADELKRALPPGGSLAVDASALTRLDAAILQLLLASAQFANDTTLTATSPAWSAAFSRYASPDPFRIA